MVAHGCIHGQNDQREQGSDRDRCDVDDTGVVIDGISEEVAKCITLSLNLADTGRVGKRLRTAINVVRAPMTVSPDLKVTASWACTDDKLARDVDLPPIDDVHAEEDCER